MTAKLRAYVHRQQFNPGFFGAFFNPFFIARRCLWKSLKRHSSALSGRILDVGCGTKPYKELLSATHYVGMEVANDLSKQLGIADVLYDGKQFPFRESSFHGVMCNQVLEHVFTPTQFLSEIRRILVKGGRLMLTVPFVWDEHEQPWDFARYSTFGLKHLLEQSDFRILHQEKLCADVSLLFQLLNAYLIKTLGIRSRYGNMLCTGLLLGPLSLMGAIVGACLPKATDLYLDQLVIAEAI